jgi:methanol metabolism-related c-type cytochrome
MNIHSKSTLAFVLSFMIASSSQAVNAPETSAAVKTVDGKNFDAKGDPTYKIGPDGTVDWYTFSGYRRYGNCLTCHGPDGGGSSFAPNLTESLKYLSYEAFTSIVINGKNNVMPSLGTDKNVVCYLDDIYVYLKARADGVVGNGRTDKHEPKPTAVSKTEDECMSP